MERLNDLKNNIKTRQFVYKTIKSQSSSFMISRTLEIDEEDYIYFCKIHVYAQRFPRFLDSCEPQPNCVLFLRAACRWEQTSLNVSGQEERTRSLCECIKSFFFFYMFNL